MNLLTIKDLSKVYKNDRGIRELNLEINSGEVLALLGPNGSGKTTAIKTMLGLLHMNKGSVIIGGFDNKNNLKDILKVTGAVIGSPAHYEYMTAYQNLDQIRSFFSNISEETIINYLEKVDLLEFKNERVKNFSTGMKQRLALACSLLHKPDLLILDEPFSGMDIEGRVKIKDLLKEEIATRKIGILISSHQIFDIEDIVTKACIINESRWIETEFVDKIKADYKNLEAYYLAKIRSTGGQEE